MRRLLIANRGEIARRIIRTAHRMGMATVAVYSDADRDTMHVREAESAVALGGTASAESYLCIDKLIDAARASAADAVHPGYGFLSENADFAQSVIDAGLTWVGPPPAAIRSLGSKSAAKAVALRQGVPVLPGYFGDDQSESTFISEAQHIGYPVMVKAVAGGGGRGMRLVHSADQLPAALQSARSEAVTGFGNGDLLIERALLNPRHVEVQVFADAHGHCIHMGERDCSVQRRHQKIIEESPSPAVSHELRAELGRCAVALAQAAGYVGGGTVEFLLESSAFFLMEMNTRLQVEHPVTEMLTGLDLVEWQLRIARGEPLQLTQEQVRWNGHTIEVRLCAEDERFTPHAGTVQRFVEPTMTEGLRFDHALENGTVVTPHYDAMLGKLIAHAPSRDEAIDQLAGALDATVLLGLPSNRSFLAACLRHPVFRAGEATIPFLLEHGDDVRKALDPPPPALVAVALAATWLGRSVTSLPCPFVRAMRVRFADNDNGATLNLMVRELGHGALQVQVGEHHHNALVGADTVTLDGVTQPADVVRQRDGRSHVRWGAYSLWVQDLSHTAVVASGTGSTARELRAPFNGKVVAVAAQAGDRVVRGHTLLTIESMKIEHQITAPRDVSLTLVAVAPGQQVAPGQVLLMFTDEAT